MARSGRLRRGAFQSPGRPTRSPRSRPRRGVRRERARTGRRARRSGGWRENRGGPEDKALPAKEAGGGGAARGIGPASAGRRGADGVWIAIAARSGSSATEKVVQGG